MKNKKIILLFTAIILLIVTTIPTVKASDDELSILNIEDPIINDVTNESNEVNEANEENEVVNEAKNEETPNVVSPKDEKKVENTSKDKKLPQTGVAEDTTLFIFIAVCLISAIYAYTRIKNFRNI